MSNGHGASPEQIQHEIAATRAAMSRTLDTIQRRFSSFHLLESLFGMTKEVARGATGLAAGAAQGARDAGDGLRDTGSEFASNLGRTVRENPVPVVLLGLGCSWLVLASRSRNAGMAAGNGGRLTAMPPGNAPGDARESASGDQEDRPNAHQSGGAAHAAASMAGSAARSAKAHAEAGARSVSRHVSDAGNAAAEAVDAAVEGTANVGRRAGETVVSGATGIRDYAAHVSHATGRYAETVRDRTAEAGRAAMQVAREHPLLVAGGLFLTGAAVAAALPRTPREDEWMGDVADDAREAALAAVKEGMHDAKNMARTVVDAAGRAAEREGITPEHAEEAAARAVKAAGRVAAATGEAARSELGGQASPAGEDVKATKPGSPD